MPDRAETRKQLNRILVVAVLDALLLIVLVYVAFVDRSDGAVSAIGPAHGLLFLLLLFLCAKGAGEGRWGWWFPAIALVPFASLAGDLKIRKDLESA